MILVVSLKPFKVIARVSGLDWKELKDKNEEHISLKSYGSHIHLFVIVYPSVRRYAPKEVMQMTSSYEYLCV